MDTIRIVDLEVFYRVGVTEPERLQPQRLLLTIEMLTDFTRAAESDALETTIDYFAVAQQLLRFAEGRQWRLIERLACEVADLLLRSYAPAEVAVEVKKFVIPEARYVSVRATRKRPAPGAPPV